MFVKVQKISEKNESSNDKKQTLGHNKKKLEHWQIIALCLMFFDIVAANFAYFFGLFLRFDFVFSQIPEEYLIAFTKFAPIYSLMVVTVFWNMHLYNSIWRFASFTEFLRAAIASLGTSFLHWIAITIIYNKMPISYYIVGTLVQFFLVILVRFSYRFVLLERSRRPKKSKDEPIAYKHNVMIIGAGVAGTVIINEIMDSEKLSAKACCVIDDNPNKWGRYINNVPVVGGREDILLNANKYNIDTIFFTIPSAHADNIRDILSICKETGCQLKRLPGVYQLANGDVNISKMKNVDVEDLLGRDPIKVDMDEIYLQLQGETILVTGGGGSIGSELCRQIAKHDPKQLIIFDIYENNAYEIEQELKFLYPNLNLVTLIGSVRDDKRINCVFEKYNPTICFHAAAHKHVPLMEVSPNESIKNNVMGTYKTAYAALRNNCKKFVLISTDKAVNPTNVMGASKRLCEMVIQSMDRVSKTGRIDRLPVMFEKDINKKIDNSNLISNKFCTEFSAVRFGNVLGSNGSVIPLFKKQIEMGGPVTVTHPDIVRYFMTIPEAVNLVLQAGVYARGGEIFVLDMGEPMKIDSLAKNLIKLSGLQPDVDIKIIYTGLRPGEKLYEEKLMSEEGLKTTKNKLIHVGQPIDFDLDEFFISLSNLARHTYSNDPNIKDVVEDIVPTYHRKKNMQTSIAI